MTRNIRIATDPEPLTLTPERTALIVVDMQNAYCSPGGYLDAAASAKAFTQVPPEAVKLGSERLLAMPGVVPRNPIITREEWDKVMEIEMGSALKQSLPFERMVDNRFAEKATAEFGLTS